MSSGNFLPTFGDNLTRTLNLWICDG